MAYDRYDTRRGREWRGEERDRGRHEDRGFFERAGDEIASWFGGSDDDRERHRGQPVSRDRNWGRGRDDRGWSREEHGWGGNPDYAREDERYAYRAPGRSAGGAWERGRFDEERGSSRPTDWMSGDRDYGNTGSGHRQDRFGSSYAESGSGSGYRPITGDYGRSESHWRGGYDRSETPWGRDDYRRTSLAGSSGAYDPHYESWRRRQLEELDRDYADYCREHQQRFESDFGSWRQKRQQKRSMTGQMREHMEVVGSDGETIGKVDKVSGDRIILTRADSDDNRHHAINCMMIDTVEGDRVKLEVPAEEAKSRWQDVDEDRGFFGRDDRDDTRGEVNLERSFSGTYR